MLIIDQGLSFNSMQRVTQSTVIGSKALFVYTELAECLMCQIAGFCTIMFQYTTRSNPHGIILITLMSIILQVEKIPVISVQMKIVLEQNKLRCRSLVCLHTESEELIYKGRFFLLPLASEAVLARRSSSVKTFHLALVIGSEPNRLKL
jgi:hypothetical protein